MVPYHPHLLWKATYAYNIHKGTILDQFKGIQGAPGWKIGQNWAKIPYKLGKIFKDPTLQHLR